MACGIGDHHSGDRSSEDAGTGAAACPEARVQAQAALGGVTGTPSSGRMIGRSFGRILELLLLIKRGTCGADLGPS